MTTIIIEHELIVAQAIQDDLRIIDPSIEVLAMLRTVEDSVKWFSANTPPDLAFMDLQLVDGSSFAIFDRVEVSCPVIFTTAYDEYAVKAFEIKGIDYLHKPMERRALERALSKVRELSEKPQYDRKWISELKACIKKCREKGKFNFADFEQEQEKTIAERFVQLFKKKH